MDSFYIFIIMCFLMLAAAVFVFNPTASYYPEDERAAPVMAR